MDGATAKRIAAATIEACRANNWNVAVAVVDNHGFLVYFERMDNTQTASVEIAQIKASAVATYRRPTCAFAEAIAKGRTALVTFPGIAASRDSGDISSEDIILNSAAPGANYVLCPRNFRNGLRSMYRIPKELNLAPAVGDVITQIRVGQFDLQFTVGPVHFAVQSPVNLFRGGKLLARWEEGKWPDPGFYDIMNVEVVRGEVVNEKLIVFEFDNGIEMHLEDSSDQYESMQIGIEGEPPQIII